MLIHYLHGSAYFAARKGERLIRNYNNPNPETGSTEDERVSKVQPIPANDHVNDDAEWEVEEEEEVALMDTNSGNLQPLRNFSDETNDDRILLTRVGRDGFGPCLQRGMQFLAEWGLDRMERHEHKPVTNQRYAKTVSGFRDKQLRLVRTGTSIGATKVGPAAQLTWQDLVEPEALAAMASFPNPSLLRDAAVVSMDGGHGMLEEHTSPTNVGANAQSVCHQKLGSQSHPLYGWKDAICNWDATHMCAHVGHETIHLQRYFPVATKRFVVFCGHSSPFCGYVRSLWHFSLCWLGFSWLGDGWMNVY